MAFSLDEYRKAKKEGRVKVGESVYKSAQSGLDSVNELADHAARQSSGQEQLWGRNDIVKNYNAAKGYTNSAIEVLSKFYSGTKDGENYKALQKSAKEQAKAAQDYLKKRKQSTETTLENPNQWFDPKRINEDNAQGLADAMAQNAYFENKNKGADTPEKLKEIEQRGESRTAPKSSASTGGKATKEELKGRLNALMDDSSGEPAADTPDIRERTAEAQWARQKREAIESREEENKSVGDLRKEAEQLKEERNALYGHGEVDRKKENELTNKIEDTEQRMRKKVQEERTRELEGKYGYLNYEQLKDERKRASLNKDERDELNELAWSKGSIEELEQELEELKTEQKGLYSKGYDTYSAKRDAQITDETNRLKEIIADRKDERLIGQVASMTNTADFNVYSKIKPGDEEIINRIVGEGNTGGGKKIEAANPFEKEKTDPFVSQDTSTNNGIGLISGGEYANKYMTEDEKKSVIYLYNTQGEEKAQEYYDTLLRTLNKRMTEAVKQGEEEYAQEHPVLASAKSVATNLGSGFGIVEDIIKRVSNQRIDDNSVYHLNARRTNAIRGKVAENIDNSTASWLYQTGMSAVVDSAVNTAIAGVIGNAAGAGVAGIVERIETIRKVTAWVSSVVMDSQVATQTVIEAKDRGLSDGQAVSLGVIYGAVEGLTEKFSIEAILSEPKSIIGTLSKAFVAEGAEEVTANVADRLTDAIVSGDKSEQMLRAKELRSRGYSDSQILMQLVTEAMGDDALSFLGGALSGLSIGGLHLATNYGRYKAGEGLYKLGDKIEKKAAAAQKGAQLKSDEGFDAARLIEQAKSSGDEKTVRLAEKLETQAAQGKTISNTNLGVLKTLTDSAFAQSKNEAKAEDNAQRQRIIDSEYSADGSEEIVKQSSRSTTNAFGNKYVKGLPVKEFTKEGKTHEVMMIYSSAREAGAADNTVLLQTKDGSLINAEGATVSGDSNYTKLLSMAGSFDTLGARGLLAYFDRYADYAKSVKKKADVVEYVKSYKQLYDAGRTGATLESIKQGGKYGYSIETLGEGTANVAVLTGNHDSDLNFRAEDNRLQRMRIPGHKNALTSKVRVEEGVVPKASAEQIQILQALAEKAGREIVLTDKVKEGVNGFFARRSGKIYLNAEIGDDAVLSVALHEVMHGIRLDAPTEFEAVRDFVFNYLESQGKNTERMIEVTLADWRGKISERDVAVEEIVCDTVMALASDEAAARRAIESEHNADRLLKLAEAIRKIAARVKQYIKDFAEGKRKKFAADGLDVGPIARETFLNDAEALMKLADMFSSAAEKARQNIESYGEVKNEGEGEKYSIEYQNAKVNQKILDMISNVKSGNYKDNQKEYLGKVTKRQAEAIQELTGLDVEGYSIQVEARQIHHIIKDHGEYGKADRSMKDDTDIAKLEYALNNYDKISYSGKTLAYTMFRNGKDRTADTVLYEKAIGDKSYYVVQAIVDTKAKSVYIVTAFIGKSNYETKKGNSQLINAKSPNATSKNGSVVFPNEIVPQSEEDVKYSVSDREYLSAVKRGDMKEAQRMVDEAAERAFADSKVRDEDGKLLKVYHGTDADFTVFDKTKGRANMDIQGMFFSPWEIDAGGYGQNVRSFYLNITNPASESTGFRALNSHKGENYAGRKAREDLERMGYDGVNNEDEEYIAFNSNQIKSADAVTYDDAGKVIPLSQRFDSDEEDIRYSVDEGYSLKHYSDKQIFNWQNSKNIVIYENDTQLNDFVDFALQNDYGQKMYFGVIDNKLAKFILSKTGMDLSGYNLTLRASEIRKILNKSHGHDQREKLRGQRAINKEDFTNIPRVITAPDEIRLSGKLFEGKPVIEFEKTINGKTTVVTYVSRKHHDLTVQTMFSGKKKGSLATTPSGGGSFSQTSGTLSGTASNRRVSQKGKKVNNSDDNSYSVQDEVYDYIAAEYNRENGTVDLDKLIRRNPSAAVQTLYRKALETAHRGLFKSRLKVSGVEIARIADSIFKRLHINKAGNIDAWDSLRADIRYFVERINRTPKGSEGNIDLFRNHFEYLSQQMADYVKLSEKYNDSTQKKARKKLEGFLGGRMLLLRPYEQVIIKKKFGSFGEFRSRLLGMTNVAYEKEGRRGYHIEDVVDFVKRNSPDMYNEELIMKDGGFEWLDILLNEYLEPSYHNEFHDQGYYEDALGRGVESAFEIMEQLIERNGAEQKNGAGTKANAYGRIENDYTEIDLIVDDNDDHEAHGLTALLNEFRETKMKAAQLETANKGLRRANTLNSEYMKRKLRSEYEERVIKNQYMSGIRRLTEHFRKMVMNPTNTSFLPPTLMQKPLLKAFEELGRAAVTREGTKTAEKMGEMVSTLNTLISGVDESKNQRFDLTGEYAEAFDKDFLDELARFEALLKGKTLTTADRAGREGMTVNEVREIYQIMQEIEHRLINARRQLLDKEGKTNSESAWSIFGEVEDTKTKLDKWKNRKAVKKAYRFLTWTSSFLMNTKRVTRFLTGYNDDAELMKHWEKINKGQREMWQYMMEAEKHFKGLTERDKETKKAYEKSLREIVNVEFVDSKGDKQVVKMTRMQGLQIVMSWQREAMSGGEMIHLASQGIEIADPEQLIKGKVSFDNAQRVKFIDPQFITAIYGTLGSFEKEYMKAAETYFNEISKDAINEVMMVMKHREIANSEYYIPFEVDKNYVKSEPTNDATNGAIENRGSWEKTVKNQNPVLISSLNLIIDRHIKSTAELKGLAIPLRNFKRAYGMTLYDRYGRQHGSVRDNLTLKFGGESVKFFDQMIADLQGKRVDKKQNKRWKVAGNTLYKVNITRALVANVGVVIKQAASYPTAGRYLTGGNLTKGIGRFFKVRYKNIIKEIDEHTPLHYMRRIGMSEQEISDMMNNRITQRLPMTKWIEAMDCFTTAALWEATKAEVESRYRNQDGKIGSKEYWDEVTELYNTVIEDTQPMYDSLHRAEAQKGAGPLARAIFMFNTQPLQNTGILYDAALELVMKGDKRSWKNFGKAAASQIASMLTFTAMTWLRGMVLHKRKKYEDEEGNMTFASTAKAFGLDTLSSIVKLLAPYGGSEMYDFIVSWIEKKQYSGFDVGSISQLEDLVNKFNNTWKVVSMDGYSHNENWARFEAIKTLLGSVSEFFGIPYTNYNNIVMSVVGYGKDFFSGYPLTDNYGNFDDEHIAEYMVKAKIEGDSKRAEDLERIWKEELKKSGMNADESAKKIKDKLRAVLAENEDVKAAAQAELDGDTAAFDRAFEKVHSYGFDEKDVRSAVDKAKTAIKKQAGGGAEDAEPEEETDVDVFEDTKSVKPIKYQLSDGFEAIKRGDRDGYETVKSYLVENGYKTEEQIEKYMSSKSRTNKMWEEYLEAQYKGDNAEIKRLVKELTNVYGSWSKAKTGLEEYQNRKKNK